MRNITETAYIEEILADETNLTQIFIQYGLLCLVCGEPFRGTIEQRARQHGVNVTDLVKNLNEERKEINVKS